MSLKRKTNGQETADVTQKKPKFDFFAPKAAAVKPGPLFTFNVKDAGTTRLTTWNVNGINSILKDDKKRKVNKPFSTSHWSTMLFSQTFIKYLDAEDPDILILTE